MAGGGRNLSYLQFIILDIIPLVVWIWMLSEIDVYFLNIFSYLSSRGLIHKMNICLQEVHMKS